MGIKVCKFGGSSLADASQIAKAVDIVKADSDRQFVVPSAPGKRNKEDQKITDLLFDLNREHGTTLILVTHDERLAARCERALHMQAGQLQAEQTV